MSHLNFFFVLILLDVLQGGVCDPGTSFVVTFPEAFADKNHTSALYFTATGSDEVVVTLTTLPTAPSVINTQLVIPPGQEVIYDVVDQGLILPTGSLLSDMSMRIEATGEITVVLINRAKSNGDFFTPIPTGKLGTEYYTVGYQKSLSIAASFVTVTAPYGDTEVNVTLPRREITSETVVIDGVTYDQNDVISVRLQELQTLQIQMSLDLTGTHIVSSKPVAVLSGQNRSSIFDSGCASHLLDQVPPIENWGKTFVLIPSPGQAEGDLYRFVAKEPMTTVTLGTGNVIKVQDAGDFGEFFLDGGTYVYAESDKPVLVVHYSIEQPTLGTNDKGKTIKDPGDPAMEFLASLEDALSFYRFATEEGDGSMELFVTITVTYTDVTSLLINGQDLSNLNVSWAPVTGAEDHVVGHVALTSADLPCTLGVVGGPAFNAHVHYVGHCECFSMALTHGSAKVANPATPACPVTNHSPGDGVDTDCDGVIDEEPCCVNIPPADTDGDSYKNEDCAPSDGNICCGPNGQIYSCHATEKSSMFTKSPDMRRRATVTTPRATVDTKTWCAMACLQTEGCWGVNFDPSGREGFKCELLSGQGMGLVTSEGWGFQSLRSAVSYSDP
ncbi:hypothetical protein BaRGS_00027377 [Batillaria attramentaria]|uniref:IgGFc-binding protein N-terminal domain-containing protein n=1 Tax=Batillaria attramentaria TaxID=370345 RepID=A0ABD0K328_9CAEN